MTTNTDTLRALSINNESSTRLHNVRLNVPKTGEIIACSIIPPSGSCAIEFQERPDRQNPVTFSWEQNHKSYTQDLRKTVTSNTVSDQNLHIQINIMDGGVLKTKIVNHPY